MNTRCLFQMSQSRSQLVQININVMGYGIISLAIIHIVDGLAKIDVAEQNCQR